MKIVPKVSEIEGVSYSYAPPSSGLCDRNTPVMRVLIKEGRWPINADGNSKQKRLRLKQPATPVVKLTHTALLVWARDVAWIAGAVVAVWHIDAVAVLADARLAALVGVHALVGGVRAHLSGRALALERAHRVDALAALAQARNGLALVNVCRPQNTPVHISGVQITAVHISGVQITAGNISGVQITAVHISGVQITAGYISGQHRPLSGPHQREGRDERVERQRPMRDSEPTEGLTETL